MRGSKRLRNVRLGRGRVLVAVAIMVGSGAMATTSFARPDAIVGGHGTQGCISNISSPGFSVNIHASGKEEITGVGVSGQVSCADSHRLRSYVVLYELNRHTHKWVVLRKGFDKVGLGTVVNPNTSVRCKPAAKANYFEASLWGRVDNDKPWTIARTEQLRVKGKINCS